MTFEGLALNATRVVLPEIQGGLVFTSYNLLVFTERLGLGAEVRIESSRGARPLARRIGTFLLKP